MRREKPIADVVEEVLRKVMGAQPPAAPAAPTTPAPAAPVEDPFLATLLPEEKESYDLAKWAEENHPEFKGQPLSGKFLAFYKAVDNYTNTERAKDPNRSFDENDEAFMSFVESSRPDIEPARWEKLKTDRLVAKVSEDTERRITDKFEREQKELKDRQLILEKRPIIESRLTQFQQRVGSLLTADATSQAAVIAKTIGEEGVQKATEKDPYFTPILVKAYEHGERAAAEFLAMTHGVKAYDAQDPVQDWLVKFIRRAGEVFAVNGGERRVRVDDGAQKSFLPRGQYYELLRSNPAEAGKHWTFSEEDVLGMIEFNTKDHINALIKTETERLTKAGFVRAAPQPAPAAVPQPTNPPGPNGAPTTPPEPVGSPRAGVTAAPGQGGGTTPVNRAMSDSELQLLGIPLKAA